MYDLYDFENDVDVPDPMCIGTVEQEQRCF